MPLPPGLQLYITSADGTRRRRVPRAQVERITTQTERFGGYGQCTVSTAIPYRQAGALTVQIGDRVETWYQGRRRYRGYVSAISPSEDEPRKVSLTALGASVLLRKQFCNRAYAFPAQGVDVSAAFAAIAQDYLLKATGPNGFRLIQSVQALPIGTTIQLLDARQKLAGDALDALVKEAGNLAVWGVDVDAAGNNRLYLRPLSPAAPPVHALPVPGKIVESATGEEQTADLVNQLLITGGAPIYPQLLHNGGFELPVYQESGAGNLVVNGGFDSADNDHSVHYWTLNSGAQSFTTFTFPPKQAAPYSGTRCLGLESTSQNATQTTTCAFVAGHNYTLSLRAAKEMDQQIATGHALLQVTGSGGTVLQSLTVSLTPTGQGYDYFSGTFIAAAGATGFQITLACDSNDSSHVPNNNGYSGGLLIDDVEIYDINVVYQDGWYTDSADATAAYVNAVNWVYRDSVFEGGYCVYLDATGADADGHDLKLQPLPGNRFSVTATQTLRYGVWLKSPPASLNPNPPKFFLELNFYDSTGNITRTPPRATFTPGFLANWTYFELVAYALAGEVAADANITWRGSGSLLVDAQSVRDAQAPAMASGSNSTVSLVPFLPDGPLVYFIKASDSYLNGTWRPASGLSNPAPYASSEATYGPRCGTLTDSSILQLTDACAVADGAFTTQAFALYRPSVTLVNDPRLYWPGETVSLIGTDGPALSPTPLPIARVLDTYDGLLKTRLEMEKEQPDISLIIKKIVQDELQRLGPGPSGSSGSGGYSSGAGGGVVTNGSAPLATSTVSGTVKTDITETGGSVVMTQTTYAANKVNTDATTAEVVAARVRLAASPFAANTYANLKAHMDGVWTALAALYNRTITAGTGLSGGGALTSNITLALSAATASVLGGVKAGSGLSVALDGTLSVTSTAFAPGSVQAPASVVFDHADYSGTTEYITWRAKNSAAYTAGAIEFYGWQTSPDNTTWTTEVFGGDTYQGLGITTGNQYARCRSYPLVTSGGTATPSGWVSSSVSAYVANPAKRKCHIQFAPNSVTVDTGANKTLLQRLPPTATAWLPLTGDLHVDSPATAATTLQIYYSTASPFGTGTAVLSTALTVSGATTYDATQATATSGFTGTLATTGIPGHAWVTSAFTALGGTNVSGVLELMEL